MLASGVLHGEYDVIFTWDSTNIRQEEAIELRVFEHVPLYVALYADHPLARRKKLTRRELKQENILYMSPSGTGNSFGDAFYISLYQRCLLYTSRCV